ncbi:cysteine desulfurase/selenocysteine lyase-like PLP dependent transferase-like protein [Cryptosporidium canis]|uniref:Cysteine desulfurase/selenocysteine lyase-like PLP dependent transferase-like protein n=1 Tax=Cryptosporidium canis TaxID=195482 RepID=A0A9D5DG00_9CRYT|nr:cysteine desulfurase/selenocysteine lyase-like PLP dependent transferase-like protein [Cryptosporidium canis]
MAQLCVESNVFTSNKIANTVECQKLYSDFLREFGHHYNKEVEEISEAELGRFNGQTYLDYTGSGLYQKSQLEEIYGDFINNAYGNAHSRNPSAKLTDKKLSEARQLLFRFFNISSDTHTIIFTGGATGGLKLVGEDFPWTSQSKFYYTRVNHNSVLGIREYAVSKGAEFRALSLREVETILAQRKGNYTEGSNPRHDHACLFAFPGKDNFSGERYPLKWIKQVQKYGLSDNCEWKVILDAAALVPNERLDISENPADFTVISFYKMFGYPTGLGALISKTDQVNRFNKVYFGGGTVVMASCDSRWCKMRESPSARFEDGTVSFLSIASLKYGLKRLEYFGMDQIERHISSLTLFTFKLLSELRHFSGGSVVHFYGRFSSPPSGGIINFNLLKPDGSFVHYFKVEQMASDNNIHLRTGCFCNPGACQDYLGLSLEDIQITSQVKEKCSDPAAGLSQKPLGSIRISFGYLSTFRDVLSLYYFIKANFVY